MCRLALHSFLLTFSLTLAVSQKNVREAPKVVICLNWAWALTKKET
jgi:hypothetical protein